MNKISILGTSNKTNLVLSSENANIVSTEPPRKLPATPEPDTPYANQTMRGRFDSGAPENALNLLSITIPNNLTDIPAESFIFELFNPDDKTFMLEQSWNANKAGILTATNRFVLESYTYDSASKIYTIVGMAMGAGEITVTIDFVNVELLIYVPAFKPIAAGPLFENIYVSFEDFDTILAKTAVEIPDYISLITVTREITEGLVYDNGKIYYTYPLGIKGLYSVDISSGNLVTVLDPSNGAFPRQYQFNGIIKKGNKLIACRATDLSDVTTPVSGALVSIDLSSLELTELATDCSGVPFGSLNDLVMIDNGGIFFSDFTEATQAVYYIDPSYSVVTKVYDGVPTNNRPNGLAYNKQFNKLYVAVYNKSIVNSFDVSFNAGVPTISNEQLEMTLNSPAPSGDGLEFIDNMTIGDMSFSNVLLASTNTADHGIYIKLTDTNEVYTVNTPYAAYNLTYDNSLLFVSTSKGIFQIDMEKVFSRPRLLEPNSLSGFGDNLKVKVLATGLNKTRNMVINQQNDIITLNKKLGIVLFRADYRSPTFESLKESDGIVLGGTPADILALDETASTDPLNHAIVVRHYDFSGGVIKLFASNSNSVFVWTYNDDTSANALLPLSEGRLLVTNLNNGTETTIDRPNGNHKTRELCFDESGNLYIQVGSVGNVDSNSDRSKVRVASNEEIYNKLFVETAVPPPLVPTYTGTGKDANGSLLGTPSFVYDGTTLVIKNASPAGDVSYDWDGSEQTFVRDVSFTLPGLAAGFGVISKITYKNVLLNEKTNTITFEDFFTTIYGDTNVAPLAGQSNAPWLYTLNLLTGSIPPLDYTTLSEWATGLRNVVGMACGPNNELWGVNMGADQLVAPVGVSNENLQAGKLFSDDNPADTIYKLSSERQNLSYGYPHGWISGTNLLDNGVDTSANTLFEWPLKDGNGNLYDASYVQYTRTELRNDLSFVQHSEATLDAHSAPIGITFNVDNGSGKVIYDGKCDQRIEKVKTISGDFALVTEHGGWNRSDPAGSRVISLNMTGLETENFYNNSSFRTAATQDFDTDKYVYRPSGVIIDKFGSVLVASDPNTLYQPGTIVVIYKE
jgi:glucose/arabinose dehydrogenase